MSRLVLTPTSKVLFVLGLLAGPVGWLGVRAHLFGALSEDIRDFLTGLGVACLVGAVLLSGRRTRQD